MTVRLSVCMDGCIQYVNSPYASVYKGILASLCFPTLLGAPFIQWSEQYLPRRLYTILYSFQYFSGLAYRTAKFRIYPGKKNVYVCIRIRSSRELRMPQQMCLDLRSRVILSVCPHTLVRIRLVFLLFMRFRKFLPVPNFKFAKVHKFKVWRI